MYVRVCVYAVYICIVHILFENRPSKLEFFFHFNINTAHCLKKNKTKMIHLNFSISIDRLINLNSYCILTIACECVVDLTVWWTRLVI